MNAEVPQKHRFICSEIGNRIMKQLYWVCAVGAADKKFCMAALFSFLEVQVSVTLYQV